MEPTLFDGPADPLAARAVAQLLDGLNPQQREAVEYDGRALLIVAGAGSGKTKVLTHRIARLIAERRAWPSQILAITFTNKAAGEMRERVGGLLGGVADGMWISTFHSACVRILRREAPQFGFPGAFSIYDASDARQLVKRLLKGSSAEVYGWTAAAAGARISKLKNELVDADAYGRVANLSDPKEAAFLDLFRAYTDALRRANAFDFDDLIGQLVYLFRAFPAVADRYRERFRYILVDEYQDTNVAQYELIRELVGPDTSLTVVGDSDQSIYAFRGADIRNISEFEQDFPGAKTILLEQNYRSTQNILSAANAVIAENFDRKAKNLWTDAGDGERIVGYAGYTAHDEGQFVADEIHRLHDDEGVSFRDVAVFYRTNAQTRALEEMLIRAGVPYRILGGTRFYERAEIKDALAYLAVIVNPSDDLALRRILNTPRRGIGGATEAALATWALERGVPLSEALDHADEMGFGPKLTRSVLGLGQLFRTWRARAAEAAPDAVLTDVLDDTGYLAGLRASTDPQDASRVENLEELVSVTAEYAKNTPDGDLEGFLTEVALVSAVDELDDATGTVSLMTLHTAKGLEFDTVFITGCEEEILPHRMSAGEPGGLAEERRLFYVGITRAKRRLFLTLATSRSLYGSSSVQAPSRFLREIPEQLISWSDRSVSDPLAPPALRGGWGASAERVPDGWPAKAAPKPKHEWPNQVTTRIRNNEGLELAPGDRVVHDTFGAGQVLEVTGAGAKAVAQVRFDSGVRKKLLIRIAPLKKL